MKLVNLHTHFSLPSNQIGLRNLSILEDEEIKEGELCSVGLHPWDVELAYEGWLTDMEVLMQHPQVVAIGECGLDRAIKTPIEKQLICFQQHIELANKHNVPLLIHSVKSYSDLLSIRKKYESVTPWVLHGYAGNEEQTKQLVKHGFQFSFGERLFDTRKDWKVILSHIPQDAMFVESDNSDIDLKDLYTRLAKYVNINSLKLVKIINNNFTNLIR